MYIYCIYTHAQEETRRDVFFLGVLMWLGRGSLQEVGIVEKRWWGFPPPISLGWCCLIRVNVKDGGGETEVSQGKLG